MSERITGIVRWYSAKGFGFVDPTGSNPERDAVYFHLSDVNDHRILKAGDFVSFEVVQVPKGFKCTNVRVVDKQEASKCPQTT